MAKGGRRGTPPRGEGGEVLDPNVLPETSGGYPFLSLRYLQPQFGIDAMSEKQCSQFLLKWAKRSAFTWQELGTHPKHGLGFEYIPSKQFRVKPPEVLRQDKYMVFRHHENQPFAGLKVGNTFYVLWVECEYGDLYPH